MTEKRRGRPPGSKNKPKEYHGYTLVPLQTLIDTLDLNCSVPIPTPLANEILKKKPLKTNIIINEEKRDLIEGVHFNIEII